MKIITTSNMSSFCKITALLLFIVLINNGCQQKVSQNSDEQLSAIVDSENGTISIFRSGSGEPVLVQKCQTGL